MCLFIQTQIELNTKPVELILSRSKRAAEPCAQPEQQNQHHTLSDSVTGSSLRLPLLTVSVLVVLFKKERKKRRNYGVRIKLPFFSNSVLILGRDICLNPCRVQTTPGSVSGQRNRYKGNKPLRKKQFPLNLFFFLLCLCYSCKHCVLLGFYARPTDNGGTMTKNKNKNLDWLVKISKLLCRLTFFVRSFCKIHKAQSQFQVLPEILI